MTAQDHRCRDLPGAPLRRVRHVKKSELRWIREIEAGCTTASPYRPERHLTHSVKQIVSVRALLSNEKKKTLNAHPEHRRILAFPATGSAPFQSFARDAIADVVVQNLSIFFRRPLRREAMFEEQGDFRGIVAERLSDRTASCSALATAVTFFRLKSRIPRACSAIIRATANAPRNAAVPRIRAHDTSAARAGFPRRRRFRWHCCRRRPRMPVHRKELPCQSRGPALPE